MSIEVPGTEPTKPNIPSTAFLPMLTPDDLELPIPKFHQIINKFPQTNFLTFKKEKTYPEQKINQDKQKLDAMKKKFDDKVREADTALEICLLQGILEEEWLGGNAAASRAHDFDDVFRQTDCVVSFPVFKKEEDEKPSQYIFLGIDATTATDRKTIKTKNDKITSRLEHSDVAEIDYAYVLDRVYDTKFLGKLKLPLVVINIPPEHTIQLQKIFVKDEQGQKRTPEEEKFAEAMGTHIFIEITRQLITQAVYLISKKLKIDIKNTKFANKAKIENNPLEALRDLHKFFQDKRNKKLLDPQMRTHELKKAAANLEMYKNLIAEFENEAQVRF